MNGTPRTINCVVNFSDTSDINASTVNVNNLTLSAGTVTIAAYSGVRQATYTISYLPASGTLSVAMPAAAVKDTSGNPNASFAATIALDFGTFGGGLDPTFGVGGTATLANQGSLDGFAGLAIYPSTAGANASKIVTAQGYTSSGKQVFAVMRYTPQGTPDTNFGPNHNGIAFTPAGVGDSLANWVALQSDGKIVAAGWAIAGTKFGNDYEFAAVRFNADGSLDTGFGKSGIAVTNIKAANGNSPGEDEARAVAIQSDGKIVVAGYSEQGSTTYTEDFAVVRYNTNGSLDSTFGSGGIVVTSNFGGQEVANGLAIQSDGKILLAGQSGPSATNTLTVMAVTRYTSTGQLDTSFNGTGILTLAPAGSTNAGVYGLLLQSSGAIVLSGWSTLAAQDLTLARLTSTGQLDTLFGGAGTGYAISGNLALARTIVQAANAGDFYVTGREDPTEPISSGTIDLGVAAFHPDGTPDINFGTDGAFALDYGGTDDRGRSLALQNDGTIIVTGISNPGSNHVLLHLLPAYPQAVSNSLKATPNPDTTVTLSASFTDANPGVTSIRVYFYLETTGNGVLEPGSDKQLKDSNTSLLYADATWDGTKWNVTLTTGDLAGLPAGTYTLYAQAVDNFGIFSDPLAFSFTVL
jgi:uncharacterized delta-60 repeat protein